MKNFLLGLSAVVAVLLPLSRNSQAGIYVFHQGQGETGQLWHSLFDGTTWFGDLLFGGVGISKLPSAVVF
jgi:hypothetical protein